MTVLLLLTVHTTLITDWLNDLRSLLSEYKTHLLNLCTHFSTTPTTSTSTTPSTSTSTSSALVDWLAEVVLAVTQTYEEQVSSLFETVKSMDSALQRRAKIMASTTNTTTTSTTGTNAVVSESLRDSDKIALQVQIDVLAFEEVVRSIHRDVLEQDKVKEKFSRWKKQVDEMVRMQLQSKVA